MKFFMDWAGGCWILAPFGFCLLRPLSLTAQAIFQRSNGLTRMCRLLLLRLFT